MTNRIDIAKKRYNLEVINPDLYAMKDMAITPIYDVVVRNNDSEFEFERPFQISSLNVDGYHAATLRELLDWEGWDGANEVIACGTTLEIGQEVFVPCYCTHLICSPNGLYGQDCRSIRKLALLNMALPWDGERRFLRVKN